MKKGRKLRVNKNSKEYEDISRDKIMSIVIKEPGINGKRKYEL